MRHLVGRYIAWLRPGARVVLVLAVAVSPVAIALWFPFGKPVTVLTVGGLALQLLGFIITWLQIADALRRYNKPGYLARLKAWAKAIPSAKARTVSLSGAASGTSSASVAIRVEHGPGDGSPEARLTAAEKNVQLLFKATADIRKEHGATVTRLQERIDAEGRSRASGDEALSERLQEQAVGGVDMTVGALLWFVAGTVYTTLPDEIAGLLGP